MGREEGDIMKVDAGVRRHMAAKAGERGGREVERREGKDVSMTWVVRVALLVDRQLPVRYRGLL